VVAAAGPEVRCAGDRASSGLGAELANLTKHDIAELSALVKTWAEMDAAPPRAAGRILRLHRT